MALVFMFQVVLPESRKKVYDGRAGSQQRSGESSSLVVEPVETHAQQSVQRIFGSLRLRETFFWLRVFSALRHFPSPPKIR